jgi:putative membrane protein
VAGSHAFLIAYKRALVYDGAIMFDFASLLPLLDAAFILASGVCIVVGRTFIACGNVTYHKRSMLTATVLAALFLIVYVTRWALFGTKLFAGEGALRAIYLTILSSHILLAIAIVPLVIITLRRALTGNFAKHKRIARWTFPLWLYVAISGWLVYWMLYHL